jgi:site-specific DNA-methyltransferase (adenine-specific)
MNLTLRQILVGDATAQLGHLPMNSIDCVITSPPYYMLRNYQVLGQIGLEPHINLWVDELSTVCRGLARVLKPTGSFWLNLGDSFSRHERYGAPAKGLLAGPERLLLRLMDDGWICRGKAIWAKSNPMPSSVTDRLNMTYEVVYHLVRSPRYYFDLDAIREPHRSRSGRRAGRAPTQPPAWAGPLAGTQGGLKRARPTGLPGHPLGKNPGDVWVIPTTGFRGAHFATFPERLVIRPLLATCPVGGVVLDPFFGSGTVGVVAEHLGREWIGIELSSAFADLAYERIAAERNQGDGPASLQEAA